MQTRLDVIADVCQLQSKVTTCTVKDMKMANNVLKRIKRDTGHFRLWYPYLDAPYRLVSVSDASHATKTTSYAHEGQVIMLMTDTFPKADKRSRGKHKTPGRRAIRRTVRYGRQPAHPQAQREVLAAACGGNGHYSLVQTGGWTQPGPLES